MKKEFKTPEINVKALSAAESIMTSGEGTGVLGGAGVTANMYKVDTSAISDQYNQWKQY